MTTRTIRITDAHLRQVGCGAHHSGNHMLVANRDHTYAECQGCGTWYTAEQVRAARPGTPGEGGVIRREA